MLKETLSEHGIMHPPNERFSCLPAARALPPPLLPPYRVPPRACDMARQWGTGGVDIPYGTRTVQ